MRSGNRSGEVKLFGGGPGKGESSIPVSLQDTASGFRTRGLKSGSVLFEAFSLLVLVGLIFRSKQSDRREK